MVAQFYISQDRFYLSPCRSHSPSVCEQKANNRKWSHIIIRHRCDIEREGGKLLHPRKSSRQFAARHYRQQEMPEMLHIEMEGARGGGKEGKEDERGRSDRKLFL